VAIDEPVGVSRSPFAWQLNVKLTQQVQRFIYRYASRKLAGDDAGDDVVFLNYGYEEDPPMAVPLTQSDEPNRYFIQLYHSTAAQTDLSGKRVLEIGCGHGGGASYIARTMQPAGYTGLDLNPDGIDFCRKKHDVKGLDFVQGDAQDLPFPDQAFDAVINVESSHLYPHFPKFLDEVARVLKPGGHFLYTDARRVSEIPAWEAALADAPFRMVSSRVINTDVTRGMEINLQRWQDVIDRVVPGILRQRFRKFSPVRKAYEDLLPGGSSEYRMYCFVRA
jgi:ubiquinone/menaquinone biosynthesis C-methylase UbiE